MVFPFVWENLIGAVQWFNSIFIFLRQSTLVGIAKGKGIEVIYSKQWYWAWNTSVYSVKVNAWSYFQPCYFCDGFQHHRFVSFALFSCSWLQIFSKSTIITVAFSKVMLHMMQLCSNLCLVSIVVEPKIFFYHMHINSFQSIINKEFDDQNFRKSHFAFVLRDKKQVRNGQKYL